VRAIQIVKPGDIKHVDIPAPIIGENDLLLKSLYIGYCGSDLNAYLGKSPMAKFPLIPGHEICARVEEAGNAVSHEWNVGDLVTVKPYFNCGKCTSCRAGRTNACRYNQTMGVQRDGAMCEYFSVDASHVLRCDGMDPVSVALAEPLAVGFHLANRCSVSFGETVAVIGCGAVGLGAVTAASFHGAHTIAVDIADEKLELAKELGASFVINSGKEDPLKEIMKLTANEGVAVALEAAGLADTCRLAIDAACYTGRVGMVSYANKLIEFDTKLFVSKELDFLGSRNALHEFGHVLDIIRNHPDKIRKMATKICDFNEADQAMRDWANNPAGITRIIVAFP
jgi:threonine dehydrogenase-like Zn-dependent dehydrogenase